MGHILQLDLRNPTSGSYHNYEAYESHFHGPIPGALRNLSSLELLDLSSNSHFNSTVPLWFYNFTSLVRLDLSPKNISEMISSDVGNLTSRKSLDMSNNEFEREVTKYLGKSLQFAKARFGRQQTYGRDLSIRRKFISIAASSLRSELLSIQKEFGLLSKINYLSLSNNSLDGVVSKVHFANLTRLTVLDMPAKSLDFSVHSSWVPPFQLALTWHTQPYSTSFPTPPISSVNHFKMSDSSSLRPRKNVSKTTRNSNAEVKRRGNADNTNNWPLQLTPDNDPTPTYDELNRVDILPDGRVHIFVGSEEITNRDELQCRGSLDKDNRLIHALVERWWPSTHSFHFPCGELGFTPLDFVMLAGISFGRGRELPYDERYSKLEEAEKMFPGITSSNMRYGNVTLSHLKNWQEPLNPSNHNYNSEIDIAYARAFISYTIGNLFFSNGATSLRPGYLAALTDYDIIGPSGFDWGMPIMVSLYRGLDEVSVLRPGKVKKSITRFYAVLEYWFFEYCRVGMYLVKRYDRMEGQKQHRLATMGQVYEIETFSGKHCKSTEFPEGSICVSPIY
ncbi:hypothetical protein GIB67_031187 [Kingdonia uniflora]|uniref:Aminotransferase-like plant mobile domain-containing protein n=1 Tax=Kingdonia uniflora TaxID=39325 RepID=A0A7J7NKW3_9MAGN|nr:hypothetical protein GIB67_031187 [Kingdonia uniflora]